MQEIPLRPIPNQEFTIPIGNDSYAFEINSRNGGLYITVIKNGIAECINRALLSFAPITTNIVLIDQRGFDEPKYSELGDRFILGYYP